MSPPPLGDNWQPDRMGRHVSLAVALQSPGSLRCPARRSLSRLPRRLIPVSANPNPRMFPRLKKPLMEIHQPAVHLIVEPLHGVFVHRDRRQGRVDPSGEELVGHGRAFSVPTDCRGGANRSGVRRVLYERHATAVRGSRRALGRRITSVSRSRKRGRAANATGELQFPGGRRRQRRRGIASQATGIGVGDASHKLAHSGMMSSESAAGFGRFRPFCCNRTIAPAACCSSSPSSKPLALRSSRSKLFAIRGGASSAFSLPS